MLFNFVDCFVDFSLDKGIIRVSEKVIARILCHFFAVHQAPMIISSDSFFLIWVKGYLSFDR